MKPTNKPKKIRRPSFKITDQDFEQIFSMERLVDAYRNVKKGKSHYHEVKKIEEDVKGSLEKVRDMVLNGEYQISAESYHTRVIYDPTGKARVLKSLGLNPHRIIQSAIMRYIFPFYCKTFFHHSCAAVPGAGTKRAAQLNQRFINFKNQLHCLKIDIRKFYDTIDRNILKKLLSRNIKSPKLKSLLFYIIDSYPGEKGIPIGAYLSQLFANLVLHELDCYCKHTLKVRRMVRYADDVILYSNDAFQLQIWHAKIKEFVEDKLNLKLKIQEKYIINIERDGGDFIGYIFRKHYILIRHHIARKVASKSQEIRAREKSGRLISKSQFCSMNSFLGYLMNCDGFTVIRKHIFPCVNALAAYYKKVILRHSRLTLSQKNRRVKKYITSIFEKSHHCGRFRLYFHKHYTNKNGRFRIVLKNFQKPLSEKDDPLKQKLLSLKNTYSQNSLY